MTRAWSESARARGICSALGSSRSLGACEDAERLDSGPRTGLVQRLEHHGKQDPTVLIARKRRIEIRMGRLERPGPIMASLASQPAERRGESGVGTVAQPRQGSEAHEEVVIIVIRVVNPEPWRVADFPFFHEMTSQVELRPTLDRAANRFVSIFLRDFRQRGQPLPAVEGTRSRRKAVPTAIRFLSSYDPSDRPLDARVLEVSEPDQRPDGVSGHTDLGTTSAQVPTFLTPPVDEQLGGPADAGIGSRHSGVSQDNREPVRGDILGAIQLSPRPARRDPMSVRPLVFQERGGPAFLADSPDGLSHSGVLRGPPLHFPPETSPDARIRFRARESS